MPLSIVVIEDNATDVFLVKETLAAHRLDAHLVVLGDGEAAINFFTRLDAEESEACPDIVLLDLSVPKADGFRVLEFIRSSKRSANIPVVVTTSSAAPADQTKASELGASAYFQKPTRYDAFLKLGEIIQALVSP